MKPKKYEIANYIAVKCEALKKDKQALEDITENAKKYDKRFRS